MNNFFYHGNLIEKRIPQHTPYDTALQILQPLFATDKSYGLFY